VLGTRFNVNAYKEEKSTITTLFEGSIKITTTSTNTKSKGLQMLVPGQKAILKAVYLTSQLP
jgi:transmembrane sensor